jgi:hypothetical protein
MKFFAIIFRVQEQSFDEIFCPHTTTRTKTIQNHGQNYSLVYSHFYIYPQQLRRQRYRALPDLIQNGYQFVH